MVGLTIRVMRFGDFEKGSKSLPDESSSQLRKPQVAIVCQNHSPLGDYNDRKGLDVYFR